LDAELVDVCGGPGRFWGYRGLRPVVAVRQVAPAVGIQAGRILRRWYRAKGLTKRITVPRLVHATGRVRYRRTRVRKRLFLQNRGFVIVNDGPAFASQLARYLGDTHPPKGQPRSFIHIAMPSLRWCAMRAPPVGSAVSRERAPRIVRSGLLSVHQRKASPDAAEH
jgi:hypothetical protein